MTVSEVAAYLRAHDKYLILTHRRPDGDTLGCAAALCAMLRQMGKTAGILYNRETTEHFEQYIEQYWVADDFDYETVVSVDLAALKNQIETFKSDMMRTLRKVDCEDAVIKGRNQLSVDTEKFSCDYYQFLNGESSAINAFVGEFMTQYSWAEITTASLQGKMTEIIR